jgi:hypothetical protein
VFWAAHRLPVHHRPSYRLTPNSNHTTTFQMTEVFSGLMVPMVAGRLPDFKPIFERYAADLKKEAEAT